MIDNVHQIRIKCMFDIDRTRSGTSNKFWQGIKQSNDTPPETIIGKCARSTNVYMRDNTISSSMLRMGAYYGFGKIWYQILYYFPDINYTVAFSSPLQRESITVRTITHPSYEFSKGTLNLFNLNNMSNQVR